MKTGLMVTLALIIGFIVGRTTKKVVSEHEEMAVAHSSKIITKTQKEKVKQTTKTKETTKIKQKTNHKKENDKLTSRTGPEQTEKTLAPSESSDSSTQIENNSKEESNSLVSKPKKLVETEKKFDLNSEVDWNDTITLHSQKLLAEPAKVYVESKKVTNWNKQVPNLNGVYEGHLLRLNRKEGPREEEVQLEIDFDYDKENGLLDGRYSLKFIYQGNNYSTKSGSGHNANIRYEAGQKLLFLDAGPDMFLQLELLDSGKKLVAYYYEDGVHVGHALLTRR